MQALREGWARLRAACRSRGFLIDGPWIFRYGFDLWHPWCRSLCSLKRRHSTRHPVQEVTSFILSSWLYDKDQLKTSGPHKAVHSTFRIPGMAKYTLLKRGAGFEHRCVCIVRHSQ